MSGKLFIQIIVLIIVAALAMTAVKMGAKCLYKSGMCGMKAGQRSMK